MDDKGRHPIPCTDTCGRGPRHGCPGPSGEAVGTERGNAEPHWTPGKTRDERQENGRDGYDAEIYIWIGFDSSAFDIY
jgi:hypothetical protein